MTDRPCPICGNTYKHAHGLDALADYVDTTQLTEDPDE